MNFGQQVIDFHRDLKSDWKLPKGVELIYPFGDEQVMNLFESFYLKYFSDNSKRCYLFGINPGRFGAGLTGIPFTDPVALEEKCHLPNLLKKRRELSSLFVYEFIDALGGPISFYSQFYITSICPLGFLYEGKNWNYYDKKELIEATKPYIIENIQRQITFGCDTSRAFSMGKGKNYTYFKKINDQYSFFDKIIPLPHPRWVMQYRLKKKAEFVNEYIEKLGKP